MILCFGLNPKSKGLEDLVPLSASREGLGESPKTKECYLYGIQRNCKIIT